MFDLDENKVTLEIELTKQTVEEIKALMAEYLWEPNEGLRLLLGAGIGALQAERVRTPDISDHEKVLRLSRLLTEAEGRLAGARYDLSEARQMLKRWELSNGAIRETLVSLEQVIKRQNQELDELKARLQACEAENKNLKMLIDRQGEAQDDQSHKRDPKPFTKKRFLF